MNQREELIKELRLYLGLTMEHKVILTGIADFIMADRKKVVQPLVNIPFTTTEDTLERLRVARNEVLKLSGIS